MEIHNAAFLATPDARAEGPAEVAWLEHGAVLVVRQGKVDEPPQAAVWVVGRDENEPHYSAFYADDRGVSRCRPNDLGRPAVDDVARHPQVEIVIFDSSAPVRKSEAVYIRADGC